MVEPRGGHGSEPPQALPSQGIRPTAGLRSSLREVVRFVSGKRRTMDGVVATTTRFRLKTYKENGFIFEETQGPERLAVSP